MGRDPLVSVAMITYNHGPFIGQAIESVLAQRRDFPIEIVISDDCSRDGTAKVIDEYQTLYPELFVRRDPPCNVGMHANLSRVWSACRGKYIALLEGDDWWHSPDKLSTQIAFMEANPEYTITGHAVRWLQMPEEREVEIPARLQSPPQKTTMHDLIEGNYLQTCSVICRRGIVCEIPTWTQALSMGDWPLFILHALHGPVGFIDQVHATYQVHEGGYWSSMTSDQHAERTLHALYEMRANMAPGYRHLFTQPICLLKRALHWRYRILSERHSLFSLKRYQLLKQAYYVDPTGFAPFQIVRNLARKSWYRIWAS